MDSLDEARSMRVAQLDKANRALEGLAHFINQHADHVDGDDRVQLRALAQSVSKRQAQIAAVLASGPNAVMQLSFAELIATLEETAMAGVVALQTLGGRLARNEIWGGPFEEDHGDDAETE